MTEHIEEHTYESTNERHMSAQRRTDMKGHRRGEHMQEHTYESTHVRAQRRAHI